MSIRSFEKIAQHEIEVQRRNWIFLAAFVIAVLIVIAAMFSL